MHHDGSAHFPAGLAAPACWGEGPLSAAATSALRCALQAYLQGQVTAGEMRGALRTLCAEGRRRQLRDEQVLIVLKGAWASLPEIRRPPYDRQRDALDALVGACVQEFYATPAVHPSGDAHRGT